MPAMIVAPQPTAVEEGAKALQRGGNAIDAAVTTAFVQSVVAPHMCGIGGYAVVSMHLAGAAGGPVTWDAPALAGSRVAPDMWEEILIRPNPDGWGYFLKGKPNDLGYQSVCTPGTVRMLSAMLAQYGTFTWEQAIAPAARIANEGFMVSSSLAAEWKAPRKFPESSSALDYVVGNAEASRIYLKASGEPYEAGDSLRNPDYGHTLEELASRGPEDFYTGTLAARMSEDLAAHGSFVTAQDLANYPLRHSEAVRGTYRGYELVTAPPPHGGSTLVAILNILEDYDLAAMGHNTADYIWTVSMAMKASFADRNPYNADPEFVEVPLAWMTSKERAAQWRERIKAGAEISVSFAAKEPPDTTHLSVVDAQGNCVALTHSLGSSSGAITPGLGFMYNNSMVNFHPLAGHPNSIAPRKSRSTGMTPTILYKDGQPVMVIGAPGATRIITSVVQVILNVVAFGMSISDAVLAPRFDCEGDLIKCQARIPEYVCEQIRAKHPISRIPQSHGGLALVHAITIDPETGDLAGAADTGAGGMALRVG